MRKHRHCFWCGAEFPDTSFPRTCRGCQRTTWLNPVPVAGLLLPVDEGFLLIRRAEAVGHGKLALPGDFIDFGETWQRACVRELFEETGITLSADEVACAGVHSSPDGFLLVFGRGPRLREVDLPPFVPDAEVSERLVTRAPVPLDFPLHEEMLRQACALS